MEAKHFALLIALFVAVPIGIRAASRSRRVLDMCAFFLLLGTTRYDWQSINLESREWYRGTTRGFEITWLDLLWMILIGALWITRRPGQRTRTPASLVGMVVFLLYNALNVAWSTPHIFGLFELTKMMRGIMVFVSIAYYVKGERELKILVWALVCAISYEFFSASHDRFIMHRTRVGATLGHPNIISMYDLIAVPILISCACSDTEPRLRAASGIAAAFGVLTVLFTVSRTGIAALGVELGASLLLYGSLKLTPKRAAVAICILVLGTGALAKTWKAIEARFSSGGYEEEYEGKVYEGRGVYLHLAYVIADAEPWGCGLNNWSYWVSNKYAPAVEQHYQGYRSVDVRPGRSHRKAKDHVDSAAAPPAHTLYGITLGETGWAGVFLFGLLWLRWLQMTGIFLFRRTKTLVSRFGVGAFFGLFGALAQSYTEWEFRQTPLFFLVNIVLGMAAAVYPARELYRRPAAR